MPESEQTDKNQQAFHELNGALGAVSIIKEQLELRLQEARDDCVREVLDNIIALVAAEQLEYQRRKDELR
ncbi:MAG: hypothetical protein ACLFQT_09805 [Thiohalophilus sp.]